MTFVPLQFGIPGGMELAVILLIAVLLFGANKIPKLARSTGQAMGEFQRGRTEIEQELESMKEPPSAESEDEGSSPVEAESESTDETK
jgi:sec-independent protein translocase protein TatA